MPFKGAFRCRGGRRARAHTETGGALKRTAGTQTSSLETYRLQLPPTKRTSRHINAFPLFSTGKQTHIGRVFSKRFPPLSQPTFPGRSAGRLRAPPRQCGVKLLPTASAHGRPRRSVALKHWEFGVPKWGYWTCRVPTRTRRGPQMKRLIYTPETQCLSRKPAVKK